MVQTVSVRCCRIIRILLYVEHYMTLRIQSIIISCNGHYSILFVYISIDLQVTVSVRFCRIIRILLYVEDHMTLRIQNMTIWCNGHYSIRFLYVPVPFNRGLEIWKEVKFAKGYSIALGAFRAQGGPSRAWAQALKQAQGGSLKSPVPGP